RAFSFCLGGGEQRRASGRLPAQTGAGNQQCAALGYWCGQRVVDRQFNVGAVVTVIDQWKFVRRLNAQNYRAGSTTRLSRYEACDHALLLEKTQNEIAYRIFTDRCQKRGTQAQPPRAN